jgi:DNA-binding response OmpR family regulator
MIFENCDGSRRTESKDRFMPTMSRGSAPRVLIADDDPGSLQAVSTILQLNGFIVFTCSDGDSALRLFEEVQPRLLILEVRMPGTDGLAVCRRVRAASDVPIVMLTVIDDQKDVAAALEAGADDCVRKPFGADELLARVHAVLRRSRVAVLPSAVVEAGPLVLDGIRHVAHLDGAELALTATEFVLLGHLVRNRDRVLTHEQILEAVWGPEYIDSRHMLRVTMSRLRQKLEGSGHHLIETLPRVGYRLQATEKQQAA